MSSIVWKQCDPMQQATWRYLPVPVGEMRYWGV
ncbi:hypothetical protein I304_06305 [Cryptococcus deuterogattii CBS 10090]|nr:hypothetical protein I304_06305 [Cryptococcus deuterogattii CBS 10090]